MHLFKLFWFSFIPNIIKFDNIFLVQELVKYYNMSIWINLKKIKNINYKNLI